MGSMQAYTGASGLGFRAIVKWLPRENHVESSPQHWFEVWGTICKADHKMGPGSSQLPKRTHGILGECLGLMAIERLNCGIGVILASRCCRSPKGLRFGAYPF